MSRDTSEEKNISIRFPASVYDKLRRLAESDMRSVNATVLMAVLEKYERDMPSDRVKR